MFFQIRKKNPSYLHSLYSGVICSIVMLPTELLRKVGRPIYNGLKSIALGLFLATLNTTLIIIRTVALIILGIAGRVKVLTDDEVAELKSPKPVEKVSDINNNNST